MDIFSKENFEGAHSFLSGYLEPTPSRFDVDLHLHLKYEHRHPTKSFKVRGAYNKLHGMTGEEKARGIVTGSAGNHGQAIALAARQLAIPVIVFVPEKTPLIKVNRMLDLGAQVVRIPGQFGEAEQAAITHAHATGMSFVSAYNDKAVILGAGTILVEWLQQVPELQHILVPVGGGGLICGMGLAARKISPGLKVTGILSEASPYMYHQYYFGTTAGVVERPTLTDGLAGAIEPGSITLDLIHTACDDILQLTEEEIAQGIAYLYSKNEIVEGSGAVGVAAVLAGKVDCSRANVGTVLTGGNIDPDVLAHVCQRLYP